MQYALAKAMAAFREIANEAGIGHDRYFTQDCAQVFTKLLQRSSSP
jgi:hypothetical protein